MDNQFKNIDIYSEQVRDILEKPPKNFLRIGVFSLFMFISLVMILSHYVRYPDKLTMTGELIVGQKNIEIVPKVSGLIDSLFTEDKSIVSEGDVLLTIQSTLDKNSIIQFYTFEESFKQVEYIPEYGFVA